MADAGTPHGLILRLAWKELRHGGQLYLVMGFAMAVAVSALVAIAGFSERIDSTLHARSAELLGGHVRISSWRDLGGWITGLPAELRPDLEIQELITMVTTGGDSKLVELKVVADNYPLLGELLIEGAGARGPPPPGTVWVEAVLLEQLGVALGQRLSIGGSSYEIGGVIAKEPDRVGGVFSLGPRVMLNRADLAGSGLLQPGSRVRSTLLYGQRAVGEQVLRDLKSRLPKSATLDTARSGLEQTRKLTDQAADYLRIALFAGLLLAAAAVALGARTLVAERETHIAVLKTLGMTTGQLLCCHGSAILALAVVAGSVGSLLGFAAQELLPYLLKGYLPEDLPRASWRPALSGLSIAPAVAALFAIPPLVRLARTPPVRVLRAAPADAKPSWEPLLGVLGICGLLLWLVGDAELGAKGAVGVLGVATVFWFAAHVFLRLLRLTRNWGSASWRYAAAALANTGNRSQLAVAALGLSTLALLVPALIQADLVRHWLAKSPLDAPNRFLIDVQPHQRAAVSELLAAHGAKQVWLRPLVRARLVDIRGTPIEQVAISGKRAARLANRENNLTFGEPDPFNRLVAGAWWVGTPAAPEISLERDWATQLGIELGDRLGFEAEGQRVEGRVTSLRQVAWESMRSNFFVIFSPGALETLPRSFVTSYYVEPGRASALQKAMVDACPNVTIIDMSQMVETLRDMTGKLALAVGVLGLVAALSGIAVLLSVILAERATLARETAVLRALGASNRQVRTMLALRFGALGGISVLLGGVAAALAGGLISLYLFEIPYYPSPLVMGTALPLGVALAMLVGLFGARRELATPPLDALRGIN